MSCRLYVCPPLGPGERLIAGEDHHYLFRVRRLRPGDRVVLFDGVGHQAEAAVTTIAADTARVAVGPVTAAPTARGPRLVVLQALIKHERMDWCVQKLVELADKFGSAVVAIRGHSDPTKTLLELVKA